MMLEADIRYELAKSRGDLEWQPFMRQEQKSERRNCIKRKFNCSAAFYVTGAYSTAAGRRKTQGRLRGRVIPPNRISI